MNDIQRANQWSLCRGQKCAVLTIMYPPPELEDGDRERDEGPITQWETAGDLLQHLNVHKPMGPDGIYP